jgi:hypothetical protein
MAQMRLLAGEQRPGEEQRAREHGCSRKVAYQSQMLAENAATLHSWDGRPGLSAYKCRFCPDWHVGHAPGSGPKPKRRFRPRRHRFGAKDAT